MIEWLKYEKKGYKFTSLLGEIICMTEDDYLWRYQKRLRLTEYYINTNKHIRYMISRVKLIRLTAKLGVNIRINSCGRGLRIAHISSVITNGDIGKDCRLFPNVLIGQNGGASPIIGDSVTIYTGATIIGNITLADRIKVGANALVNKSFTQPGVNIGGVPARILNNIPRN